MRYRALFKQEKGSLQICITIWCEIVKSKPVLTESLMLTITFSVTFFVTFFMKSSVMFFAEFSAMAYCSGWCACFCSDGCADFGVTDSFCCGGNKSTRLSSASSSTCWIRMIRESICSAEKPENEIWWPNVMM